MSFKVIREVPQKNWNLQTYDDDGVTKVRTGWYNSSGTHKGTPYTEGPNLVIETGLVVTGFGRGRSSVTYDLEDKDGFEYEAGGKCAMLILMAIQSGLLTVADGYFHGQWTFVKQGDNVYIAPADPKTGKPIKVLDVDPN